MQWSLLKKDDAKMSCVLRSNIFFCDVCCFSSANLLVSLHGVVNCYAILLPVLGLAKSLIYEGLRVFCRPHFDEIS